jgi:hypothetical protein
MNTLSGQRSYDTVLTLDGLSQFDSSIQTQALLIDGSNAMFADINANGHVVKNLDDGVNASDSCTYGQMTTTNTAQTTAITAAYTSADNLRLLLAGGVMSGTVSSTTVTTPFDYKNPNGTIVAKLEAGTTAVTNTCTIQMSSNASSILEFRDNLALNVKAQLKYTYGTPGAVSLIVGGSQVLSASDTTLTCGIINMQNNRIFGLAATPTTDQDAVPRLYMVNAIADEATARTSGDAAVVASSVQKSGGTMTGNLTFSGGNINMGTGYIGLQNGTQPTDAVNKQQMEAADAVVVASSVQKTGSALTGGLTWSNVATPISAVNTGGPINVSLSAGTSSATQVCSMKMASNSQSYTEFTDVAGVTKAWIRYLASGSGSIDLTVANNPMATLTSSTVTLGGTVQLGGNRVTGMGAPTADTDAATRLYVTNADTVVTNNSVQKNGSTMSGSLNMGGTNRVTNMAASSVDGDAVRRQELYGVYLPLSGGTMTGALVANAGLTVNGAGITVNAPTVMNGNLTINGGVLARNMWYPGETIQRKWLSPALSDTLAKTTIAAASSEIIVTTTLPVTAYNHVIVRGAFEVTANNSANDTYRIEFGFSTQTVTFNNVLGAVNGYRTRYNVYEFMFVPTSSGTKTIKATLYNDSTSDTITVSDLNWTWTIEEIQA